MGRKIPAKKHRGVKDPLIQQAKRIESLKGKINAPPKDPDEQPVPRSLIRLFGLAENKRADNKKQRQTSRRKESNTDSSSNNPISHLRKLPGETGRGFSLRINSAVKALHSAEENLDYPHDFEAEDYKGQRMAEQRERRAKKRRRAEKAQRSDAAGEPETHLTRPQKLALKKKAKRVKALEEQQQKAEVVYERVSFGEVTHAPPALHFKSRNAAARPGRRELLLSALLGGGGGAGGRAGGGDAELARRERARLAAVEAYRALKAAKYKQKK